ncbi:MAG: methionine adenosyltransferase [Anaerolineales bacterium]|nr:methionine adenosyltransferase [Anaerolineales bacterium]
MSNSFMKSERLLFTSESVTEGHPDKMCDQISDAVLDAIMARDPHARVACEVAVKTGFVMLLGEITTDCNVDFDRVVRGVIAEIGYNNSATGFDAETCGVQVAISSQSPDIARGVEKSMEARNSDIAETDVERLGAGDQGMMFGFACDETDVLMPMPIYLAHRLTHRLAQVRHSAILPWVRPDGKSQVTVEYNYGKPKRIDTVLISTQHDPGIDQDEISEKMTEHVIMPVLPPQLVSDDLRIITNPTGSFITGGPKGDAGLTGRKIIVDTYGGMGRHGGGAFSGKDCTKVDRSASYAARWVAKNLVAAGIAERCEIQISYAIGVAKPLSINVETFGTGTIEDAAISAIISKVFDLRPGAIIRDLDLRRPIYRQTAAYGHFGREDLDLPWERIDKVEALQAAVSH